jgi:protein-S-isoprenylcysteine O-methyltransferase Ste14
MLLLAALLVFAHPTWSSWTLLGAPFLLLGQGLRTWAVGYIHKDRELATTGPYAFCRHPLYLGTFLSGIGVCALVGSWHVGLIFAAIFTAVYIPTIRQEDTYLEGVYGEDFRRYAEKVPAFFPGLRAANVGEPGRWSWRRLIANEEHLTWIALVLFLLAIAAKQRLW